MCLCSTFWKIKIRFLDMHQVAPLGKMRLCEILHVARQTNRSVYKETLGKQFQSLPQGKTNWCGTVWGTWVTVVLLGAVHLKILQHFSSWPYMLVTDGIWALFTAYITLQKNKTNVREIVSKWPCHYVKKNQRPISLTGPALGVDCGQWGHKMSWDQWE